MGLSNPQLCNRDEGGDPNEEGTQASIPKRLDLEPVKTPRITLYLVFQIRSWGEVTV
jgi:hypothetical protein